MTYFDQPQLFPPPPAPPAPPEPPRRKQRTGLLTALVVIAVIALLGGIAVGRVTASSSHTSSAAFVSPNNGGFQFPFGNNGSGNNGSDNGGFNPFGNDNGSQNNGNGNSDGNSDNPSSDSTAGRAAQKVTPSVVNINTKVGSGAAAGTGMIISSDGDVLTNNHVINGATAISVEMADGSRHSAKVLGYDATDDVALIHIEGVSNLPTIDTDGSTPAVGDSVIAIGNALGKGGAPSVVTGSVTAVDQTITASDESGANAETLHNLIQTDAPIQPGDSGGPLVNTDGEVIGMDAAASSSNGSGFGFRQSAASEGYAIPIDHALSIAKDISDGNETGDIHVGERGIMGVALQSGSASNGSGDGFGFGSGDGSSTGSGAVVGEVQSGSPADKAGIEAGDTITRVGGQSISSAADLTQEMNDHHPGDRVSVQWTDGSGNSHQGSVTLVAGPPA